MRKLNELDQYRCHHMEMSRYGQRGDDGNGMFLVPSKQDGGDLRVLASDGGGWDHVSVSRSDRCPTWDEMEQIAQLFFGPKEVAVQLHVPASEHVNVHPHCLHWWRPNKTGRPWPTEIPRPPAYMVG